MLKISTQRLALSCALALTPFAGFSQKSFWQVPSERAPLAASAPAKIFATYRLNLSGLRADVAAHHATAKGSQQAVELPLPDGRFVRMLLTPNNVLTSDMQAEHPEIQTFKGESADGLYSVRFTVSPHGAFARIHTPGDGLVYIQPLVNSAPEWSAVYFARDVENTEEVGRCGVNEEMSQSEETGSSSKTAEFSYGDANLRTYVMAVATNGEYTAWAGGQAQALTQIIATANNLNAIFERDLGVTFIVTSPASVRFIDPLTDPYGTTLDAPLLLTNHATLDAAVGSGNYGLGHLFSGLNWGGLAYNGLCSPTHKGGAASGTPNPTGAGWEVLVAHEVGHQFGASHSFSASNGSCGSNISAANGWEPGGGSTIMAYSSSCTGNSYQNGSDPYFHGGSLSQMGAIITGFGNSCAALTTPANAAPTLTVSPLIYTIPHSTAFRLSGTGADANNTGLTYTYEQVDAIGGTGISTAPVSTATSGPLFRSYPPSTSSARYFPNLASLLAGTPTPYEVLPTVPRTMNFRATLRDNNPAFGRTAAENIVVNTAGCGPFEITSQAGATSLTADGTTQMTVNWNNAAACVTCPDVTLKYTSDGGATFTTLLASTPNDGTETILVPNLPTCGGAGRLMLECSSDIFFDVNAGGISITNSGCAANGATITPSSTLTVATAGDAALNQPLSPVYGTTYTNPIVGALTAGDPAATLTLLNTTNGNCINFGNSSHYDSYSFQPTTTGTYTFTANTSQIYTLYEGSFNAGSPCSGFLSSSGTFNGASYNTGTTVSASLCAGRTYTLVALNVAGALSAYSITVTGGSISSGTPNPGGGFSYSYVIVNRATGNIVSIQSTGDMSNSITFPTALYDVYGVSSSIPTATLATDFPAGTSFSTFRSAVLNQTSGLCASFSSNSRLVNIGSLPLPLSDLRFEASLTGRRSARASWKVSIEASNIQAYQVERSYDGQRFEVAATLAARGLQQYEFAEGNLKEEAAGVYYRLATRKSAGNLQYTPNVYLPFEAAVESASLVVAPNPIQGGVLRAQVGMTSEGTFTATILDATGRAVYNAPISLSRGMQSVEFPVKDLSAGVYILRIAGAGAPLQVRFVKSK